ncbi:hypothetical protein E2C01_019698 [Portunus trituberculatus]|uniref:Uncharacterized protein n=1 Tax=Portunus trituberculatus TaxID=210409 RepID=A0A5B7E033_PORTR|nr:hypothetical protein [Portunus trituberculatus]
MSYLRMRPHQALAVGGQCEGHGTPHIIRAEALHQDSYIGLYVPLSLITVTHYEPEFIPATRGTTLLGKYRTVKEEEEEEEEEEKEEEEEDLKEEKEEEDLINSY